MRCLEEYVFRLQHLHDLIDALLDAPLIGGQNQVGRTGRLVGRGDTGKVAQFARIRRCVDSVGVTLATDLDRRRNMHNQQSVLADHIAHPLTDPSVGCHERTDANHPCIVHKTSYFDATAPHATGGVYVNFVPDGEAPIDAAYGPNYERLVSVKRKYDPDNLFRFNQNIAP